MKKNPKRLDPVIKYREQVEKDFQIECKRMREVLLMEEEKLSSLEIAQEKSIIELQEKQDMDISLHEACIYYSFLNSVTQEINKQKEVLREIQEQFEEKRKVLLVAHQDKRVLEILKDKMSQEVLKCETVRERQFLDEVSQQGFFKRKQDNEDNNVNSA